MNTQTSNNMADSWHKASWSHDQSGPAVSRDAPFDTCYSTEAKAIQALLVK